MNKQFEKMMTDLQRLLASQNFESEEEMKKFMESFIGQQIPEFDPKALSPKEAAQDLVFEAYTLPEKEARNNIAAALSIDPDCIEAYEYLASVETIPEVTLLLLEKGISIGRRIFGGKFLKQYKGMFWGIHETRPFMRCLFAYSAVLYLQNRVKECVEILEEMIELNPNDNQGIRDFLLLYLLELDERKKFLKYSDMFEDDYRAFPLFNYALFTFISEGETENSNEKLKEAMKQNKHVAKKLLAKKPSTKLVGAYGFGDASEANYYVMFAQPIWTKTPGAKEWLQKHAGKK